MMKPFLAVVSMIALLVTGSSALADPPARVDVCHVPPGNPANFHTITVGQNALAAHLGHGDVEGSCNAHCALLCDDDDACTIDDGDNCEAEGCPTTPEVVDCDDSNLCTADLCDGELGCTTVPVDCDDGDPATTDSCQPEAGCIHELPGCAAVGAVWDADGTGNLDGNSFTMTGFGNVNSFDLSGSDFSAAPLADDQAVADYRGADDVTLTFSSPVTDLLLYPTFWREDVYTLSHPVTVLSGMTDVIVSGGGTVLATTAQFSSGVLRIDGTISSLTITSPQTCPDACSFQALTVGLCVD